MKTYLVIPLLLLLSCQSQRITPDESLKKLGDKPYFMIDGKEATLSEIKALDENNIAAITTYFDKEATSRFGAKAKDGAVLLETSEYATTRFEKVLSKKSVEYQNLIASMAHEDIRYVLNGTPLAEGYEGLLASLTAKTLRSVEVIDSLMLHDLYPRTGKKAGVLIRAKPPKDIFNANVKF